MWRAAAQMYDKEKPLNTWTSATRTQWAPGDDTDPAARTVIAEKGCDGLLSVSATSHWTPAGGPHPATESRGAFSPGARVARGTHGQTRFHLLSVFWGYFVRFDFSIFLYNYVKHSHGSNTETAK